MAICCICAATEGAPDAFSVSQFTPDRQNEMPITNPSAVWEM
jgi:hypothetical protein